MTEWRVSKSFTMRTPRTERVLAIAEAFGLGLEEKQFWVFKDLPVRISQGDVVFITGQSGSGKSQLLKVLIEQMTQAGLKARVQPVVATVVSANRKCSSNASAGVLQPRVLRGLVLRASATASRASVLWALKSVPFGKY